MSGQILTHADITADIDWSCDVCIVGSGAGGSVLAAGLVEAGLDVVMIEEGSRVTHKDFTLHEAQAIPDMYQDQGTRATADRAITVLQGRTVGGTTTINWTTCFRTPERILSHWQQHFGIELGAEELAPHFEAVEKRLSIETWAEAMANKNNQALLTGARALGWEAGPLRRNVKGCANSGYCGLGCPVDGKQAMGITYIPDAVAGGMRLLANVRAEKFVVDNGRVTEVAGQVMTPKAPLPDGPKVRVKAKVFVSSAGAINGPRLLLMSGLDRGGLVGRRTFVHPVVSIAGEYEEVVNPFWGAPQSAGSHEFIDRGSDRVGFFLEAAPLQPLFAAVAFNSFGQELMDVMARLPHVSSLLSLSVDGLVDGDEGGVVTVRKDGRADLDYPVGPALMESFRASHDVLARIHLAAGAKRAASLHSPPVELRSEADLHRLASAEYGAHKHAIFTAHQMGGCTMGADPERSVVDLDHRFRGVDNLFVVDGSVLPTALGVNPSQTIYGLAHRARRFVGEAV